MLGVIVYIFIGTNNSYTPTDFEREEWHNNNGHIKHTERKIGPPWMRHNKTIWRDKSGRDVTYQSRREP